MTHIQYFLSHLLNYELHCEWLWSVGLVHIRAVYWDRGGEEIWTESKLTHGEWELELEELHERAPGNGLIKLHMPKTKTIRGERNSLVGTESVAGTTAANHSDSNSTQLNGKYISTIVWLQNRIKKQNRWEGITVLRKTFKAPILY